MMAEVLWPSPHAWLGALLVLASACPKRHAPPAPAASAPQVAAAAPPSDRDGDGFVDGGDACPDDPGVEPQGCPVPDADGDGILDPDDRCPAEPETRNGYADEDGCADELLTDPWARVDFGLPTIRWDRPNPSAPPPSALRGARGGEGRAFLRPAEAPRVDLPLVDDPVAYTVLTRYLAAGQRPPPGALAMEGSISALDYDDPPPVGDEALALHAEVAACPWAPARRLVRLAVRTREAPARARAIVLVVENTVTLHRETAFPKLWSTGAWAQFLAAFEPTDSLAVVTMAGYPGLAVPRTPVGALDRSDRAFIALATEARETTPVGLTLAYETARRGVAAGTSRQVILLSGGLMPLFGRAELGTGDPVALARRERARGTILSVVSIGPDTRREGVEEELARAGGGRYVHADSPEAIGSALRQIVRGADVVVARDVSLAVTIDPTQVASYRVLAAAPAGAVFESPPAARALSAGRSFSILLEVEPQAGASELLIATLRARQGPRGALREQRAVARAEGPARGSDDLRFAAAVAALGLLLRDDPARGTMTLGDVIDLGRGALGRDASGQRRALVVLLEVLRAGEAADAARRAAVADFLRGLDAAWAAPAAASVLAARRLPVDADTMLFFLAKLLRENPAMRVEIAGHTDDREAATREGLLALARARAEAVARHLVAEEGIDPRRLELRAVGPDEPVEPFKHAASRKRNRRVEFVVLSQ